MEEVEESVRQSFALYKESKRKILPLSEPSSKRLKIWLGKKKMEGSDSEDEDGDSDNGDEKSVVLDDAKFSNQTKVDEGSLASGSSSGANSVGESSDDCSAKSNIEEVNGEAVLSSPAMEQGSGSGDNNSESDEITESKTGALAGIDVKNCVFSGLEEVVAKARIDAQWCCSWFERDSEGKAVQIRNRESTRISTRRT